MTDVPLPGFDNSAMDGYAVRAVDTRGASAENPVELPVVGDVVAGTKTRSGMGPGLAMRIMTGAPIPAGADAVIPLERTDRGVARVRMPRRHAAATAFAARVRICPPERLRSGPARRSGRSR